MPFEGDPDFFFVRPQTYTHGPPAAEVSKNSLRLTFTRTDNNGAALKAEYDKALAYLREALQRLRTSADPFNAGLPALAAELVARRKKRLLDASGMAASLGLPIRKRAGVPETYSVPIQRKAPVTPPRVLPGGFKPEPELSTSVYEKILRLIRNMVQVMEYSPGAFTKMGEEDLRTHFLVQLNGHFEGQATGETFNYEGKTDILVRADGRNVFIAECKFWKGEKAFTATIDQLLSYLSWRDTKAALLDS